MLQCLCKWTFMFYLFRMYHSMIIEFSPDLRSNLYLKPFSVHVNLRETLSYKDFLYFQKWHRIFSSCWAFGLRMADFFIHLFFGVFRAVTFMYNIVTFVPYYVVCKPGEKLKRSNRLKVSCSRWLIFVLESWL